MTHKQQRPGSEQTARSAKHNNVAANSTPTAPRYPKAKSMAGRALARLLKGQIIDHHSFLDATASYRLSRDIHVLAERYGWPIERADYNRAVRDGARIVMRKFRRYWLDRSAIRHAGERAQKFVQSVARYEHSEAA